MDAIAEELAYRLTKCFAPFGFREHSSLRRPLYEESYDAHAAAHVFCQCTTFVADYGVPAVSLVLPHVLAATQRLSRQCTAMGDGSGQCPAVAAAQSVFDALICCIVGSREASVVQKQSLLGELCRGLLTSYLVVHAESLAAGALTRGASSSCFDETRPEAMASSLTSPAAGFFAPTTATGLCSRCCAALSKLSRLLQEHIRSEEASTAEHSLLKAAPDASKSCDETRGTSSWRFEVQLLLDLAALVCQQALQHEASAGLAAAVDAVDRLEPSFVVTLRLLADVASTAASAQGAAMLMRERDEVPMSDAAAADSSSRLPTPAMLQRARRAEVGASITVPASLVGAWRSLLLHSVLRSMRTTSTPSGFQQLLSLPDVQPLWAVISAHDTASSSVVASTLHLAAKSAPSGAGWPVHDSRPISSIAAALVCAEYVSEAELHARVTYAVQCCLLGGISSPQPVAQLLLHPIARVRAAAYGACAEVDWSKAQAALRLDWSALQTSVEGHGGAGTFHSATALTDEVKAAHGLLSADRHGFLRCCAASGAVDADASVRRACLRAIGSCAVVLAPLAPRALIHCLAEQGNGEVQAHASAARLAASLSALASLFAAAAATRTSDGSRITGGTDAASGRIGVIRVERVTPAAEAASVAASIATALAAACTAATAAALLTDLRPMASTAKVAAAGAVAIGATSCVELLDAVRRAFHSSPDIRTTACLKLGALAGCSKVPASPASPASADCDSIAAALEATASAAAPEQQFLPPAASQLQPLEWLSSSTGSDLGICAAASRAPVPAVELEKTRRLLADPATEPALRSALAMQLWRDGRAAGWAPDAASQEAQVLLLRTCVRLMRVHEALADELDSTFAAVAATAASSTAAGYDDTSPAISSAADEAALQKGMRAEVDTVQVSVLTLLHGLLVGSRAARGAAAADAATLTAMWRCVSSSRIPAKARMRAAASLAVCAFAADAAEDAAAGAHPSEDIQLYAPATGRASAAAHAGAGSPASRRSEAGATSVLVLAAAWNGCPLLRHTSIAAPDGAPSIAPAVARSKTLCDWYNAPIESPDSPLPLTPVDLLRDPAAPIASAILSAAAGNSMVPIRDAGRAADAHRTELLCRNVAAAGAGVATDAASNQSAMILLGLHAHAAATLLQWDTDGMDACSAAVSTIAGNLDAACSAVAAVLFSSAASARLVDAVAAVAQGLAAAANVHSSLARVAADEPAAAVLHAQATMTFAASLCGGVLHGLSATLLASVEPVALGSSSAAAGQATAPVPEAAVCRAAVLAALRLLHSLLAASPGPSERHSHGTGHHRCEPDARNPSMLRRASCQAAAALLHDGGTAAFIAAVLSHSCRTLTLAANGSGRGSDSRADHELLQAAAAAAEALTSHTDLLATQVAITPASEFADGALRPRLVLEAVVAVLAPAVAATISSTASPSPASTSATAAAASASPRLVDCLVSPPPQDSCSGRSALLSALHALQQLFAATAATSSEALLGSLLHTCSLIDAEKAPPADAAGLAARESEATLPSVLELLCASWGDGNSLIAACTAGRWFDGGVLAAGADLLHSIITAHAACSNRSAALELAKPQLERLLPTFSQLIAFWRAVALGQNSITIAASADLESAAAAADATASILAEAAAGRVQVHVTQQVRRLGPSAGSLSAAQAAAAQLLLAIGSAVPVGGEDFAEGALASIRLDSWEQRASLPADIASAFSSVSPRSALDVSRFSIPPITVTLMQAPLLHALELAAASLSTRSGAHAAASSSSASGPASVGMAESAIADCSSKAAVAATLFHGAAAAWRRQHLSSSAASASWPLLSRICDAAMDCMFRTTHPPAAPVAAESIMIARRDAVVCNAALTLQNAARAAAELLHVEHAADDGTLAAGVERELVEVSAASADRMLQLAAALLAVQAEAQPIQFELTLAVAATLRFAALSTSDHRKSGTAAHFPFRSICALLSATHGGDAASWAAAAQLAKAVKAALQCGALAAGLDLGDSAAAADAVVALALAVADGPGPARGSTAPEAGVLSGLSAERPALAKAPTAAAARISSVAADLSHLLLLPSDLSAAAPAVAPSLADSSVLTTRTAGDGASVARESHRMPLARGSVLSSITAASSHGVGPRALAGSGRWDTSSTVSAASSAARTIIGGNATHSPVHVVQSATGHGLGMPAGQPLRRSPLAVRSHIATAAGRGTAWGRATDAGGGGGGTVEAQAIPSGSTLGALSARLSMSLLQLQVHTRDARVAWTRSGGDSVGGSVNALLLPADAVASRLTAAASNATTASAACALALAQHIKLSTASSSSAAVGGAAAQSSVPSAQARCRAALGRLSASILTACDGLQRVLDAYAEASAPGAAVPVQPLLADGARSSAAFAATSLWAALVSIKALLSLPAFAQASTMAGAAHSSEVDDDAAQQWWAAAAGCLDWLLTALVHPAAGGVSAFLHPPTGSWGGLLKELLETLKCAAAIIPVAIRPYSVPKDQERGSGHALSVAGLQRASEVAPAGLPPLFTLLRAFGDCVAACSGRGGEPTEAATATAISRAVRFAAGSASAAASSSIQHASVQAAEAALHVHALGEDGDPSTGAAAGGLLAPTQKSAPLQLLRALGCVLARLAARWGGTAAQATLASAGQLARQALLPAWRALQQSPAAVARAVSDGSSPLMVASIEVCQLLAVAGDAVAPESRHSSAAAASEAHVGLPESPLSEESCSGVFDLAVCCTAAGAFHANEQLALAGLMLLEVLSRWRAHESWWTTSRAGVPAACAEALQTGSDALAEAAAACVRTAARHSARARAALAVHPALGALLK